MQPTDATTAIPLRPRLAAAIAVGLLSALICGARLQSTGIVAGDYTWAWRGAQLLLAGENPYALIQPTGPYPYNDKLYYPLPALLIAVPTSPLPGPLAGAVFLGLSSGLLCWGLLREGWHRLPVFLSASYVYAVMTVQWAPLLTAAALLGGLAPALLAKPNLGLPILLAYGRRIHYLLCAAVALLSLLIMPSWPREWLGSLSQHLNYTPLLSWFGPFLLLALIRWREPGARLLLGLAIVPQRLLYDQVSLWLLPTTLRGSLLLTVASWIGMLAGLLTRQGMWGLAAIYLAGLWLILEKTIPWSRLRRDHGTPSSP